MTDEEKLDKIYEMVMDMRGQMPNLVPRIECITLHNVLKARVDRIYILGSLGVAIASFLGGIAGYVATMVLKAKGVI